MPETDVAAAGDAGPDDLHRTVQEFTAALAREQDLADRREEVITRLHTELQELRRGELNAVLDLVRHSLIRLHDQIMRQAEHVTAPLDVEELSLLLRALADDAADAVAGTGVERYVPEAGEPYDPAWHRPAGRAAAQSPEQNNTVGRVVAAGFAQGERIVRKAEVMVARWEPQAEQPQQS